MSAMTKSGAMLALSLIATACSTPDFDGYYQVSSYAVSTDGCASGWSEIEPEFLHFRIRERSLFGVTIYPLHACDGLGNCDVDNHDQWNLVTVEDDQDQVSMTTSASENDVCWLSAVELVIDSNPDPESDGVVLERRIRQLMLEPYAARDCTPNRAKAMRNRMECLEVLRIIGIPQAQDDEADN